MAVFREVAALNSRENIDLDLSRVKAD